MTPDECQDERFRLLYCAEYSTRYHRRRANFLGNLDTLLNLITVAAGASTLSVMVAGSPGWASKAGAALVTVISLAQVLLRIGSHASLHTQWLKGWSALYNEMKIAPEPTASDVAGWLRKKSEFETECVGELRALCFDCENAAARVMNLTGRQVSIEPLQRLFIHFGTYQSDFPREPDRPAIHNQNDA